MKKIIIDDILNRLIKFFNLKNDSALARKLNISPSNISMWRLRQTADWIKIFELDNIDLNYIILGRDFSQNVKSYNDVEYIQELKDRIVFLEKLIDKQRRDFLKELREAVSGADFKQKPAKAVNIKAAENTACYTGQEIR